MCGICGYISKQPISSEQLTAMNNTMEHRGPDDSGIYQSPLGDFFLGLAHRRLSIIDLSPAGHQPMFGADGQICIVYNGEIYNFMELRNELAALGHRFHSQCDTEVILEGYLEWGIECLKRFNGMFAFCLVDFRTNTMYFARDRVGKKPLYYYYDGETLVFGSGLRALMTYPGFPKKLRQDVLARYLHHGYIAAPDTFFEKTYKLMAGQYMTWRNGQLEAQRYWSVLDCRTASTDGLTYSQAKEQLRTLLIDAVRKRMLADVPVGTFLSGGIDSTLVTALAQQISAEPVKSYSIGFKNPVYDEAPFAREIAEHLGTDHHELYISEDDFLEAMNGLPDYYDEPFADSSQIPTMLVSQFARQDVTVVLSGDGGDELFCGYNTYQRIDTIQKKMPLGRMLMLFTSPFHGAVRRYFPPKVRKGFALLEYPKASSQLIPHNYEPYSYLLLEATPQLPIWYRREENIPEDNWQIRRMLLDVQTYMSDDILVKVDRASMRYALEARCPILDPRVIAFAFSIPHKYAYYRGEKKRLIKDLLYDYVPKPLLDRPKKGFSIPIGHYLRTTKRSFLKRLSDRELLREQGIFRPEAAVKLIRDFQEGDNQQEALVWKYCMFQQWYDWYMR